MQGRRGLLLAAVGVMLGIVAGLGAWGRRSEALGASPMPSQAMWTPVTAPVEGGRTPEFEAIGVDGDEFRLGGSLGRIVVLNFWATWCEPCRTEMPLLDTVYDPDASSGVLVVGVDVGDSPDQVRAFRDALKLNFPLVLDPEGEIEALYRVRGFPTTFFIDEAGVIQHVHVGAMDAQALDGYLNAMGLN